MIQALISIGIFLILQLVGAVWWASSMNTKMMFMVIFAKDIKDLQDKIFKKEDAQAFITRHESSLKTMWDKFDTLKKEFDEMKVKYLAEHNGGGK